MELKRYVRLIAGVIVSVTVLALAVSFGEGPTDSRLGLSPPGVGGILGTAPDGRDLFRTLGATASRSVLWSGIATVLTMAVGAAVGIAGAEWRDRVVDRAQSMGGAVLDSIGPFVICACVASVVPEIDRLGLVILVAVVSWPSIAVAVRKEILATKTKGYYEAALSLGLGPVKIFVRHVLPNVVDRIVPLGFALCAAFLGLFGALDFVGAGTRSESQLGAMIYDAINYADAAPWYFWSPVVTLGVILLTLGTISSKLCLVVEKGAR